MGSVWVLIGFWLLFGGFSISNSLPFFSTEFLCFSVKDLRLHKAKHVFSVESIHFRNENDIFYVEITFSLKKFTTSQSGARFLSEPIHFRNENYFQCGNHVFGCQNLISTFSYGPSSFSHKPVWVLIGFGLGSNGFGLGSNWVRFGF